MHDRYQMAVGNTVDGRNEPLAKEQAKPKASLSLSATAVHDISRKADFIVWYR